MPTNSILINFIGYPQSLRALYLDNGLANLAACLIERGNKTTIFDYATVDSINYLYPYKYKDELLNSLDSVNKKLKQGVEVSQNEINNFHKLDGKITEYKRSRIMDLAYDLGNTIEKNKIDFIGFKLWTGEGFIGSMLMANELKRRFPKLHIFAGGPQVDWFGGAILKECPAFDLLAYGEGEETIVHLSNYVEGKSKLEDIPNLIYRKNGTIATTFSKRVENLDDLPTPVYDQSVYPANNDNQKIKMISIEECRGCPNSCNFCVHPIKSGPRWRLRDPKKTVDQIEGLMNEQGIKVFRFTGSNPPPKIRISIAKEIIERGISVKYSGFGHVKGMSKNDYKILKESGCKSIFFGVESGNQDILTKIVNKKFTANEVKQALLTCKDVGIPTVASVIIPMPDETEITKQATIDLLKETQPDVVFVNFPSLQPGTKWALDHGKYGFEINNHEKFFYEEMMYEINSLYPSVLWSDISEYKLNGKSFNQVVSESEDFAGRLKKDGLLPYGSDDLFLLADSVEITLKNFLDGSRENLLKGEYYSIKNIVENLNSRICSSDVIANTSKMTSSKLSF